MDETAKPDRDIADVLAFWFVELRPGQWFKKDDGVDAAIRDRFGELYRRFAANVLRSNDPRYWEETPRGCLAAVIVLDQFPRNIYRDDPRAFATDAAALAIATNAIGQGFDRTLGPAERMFLYMPFQHSEERDGQARSVELFATIGEPGTLEYARRHQEIIERFGRFPHRNAVLGRESTEAELAFLEESVTAF